MPVVEGESHRPEDCIKLGKCVVRNLPPDLPAGTSIEVEYRYGGNGCVSVSARVPSARQSAHVEIERELTQEPGGPPDVEGPLVRPGPARVGQFRPRGGPVDPADRSSVVKRLDSLCMRVGRPPFTLKVPESIEQCRRMRCHRRSRVEGIAEAVGEAEKQRQGAVSTSDIIRFDAALTQARAAMHQAQVKSDFAHLCSAASASAWVSVRRVWIVTWTKSASGRSTWRR